MRRRRRERGLSETFFSAVLGEPLRGAKEFLTSFTILVLDLAEWTERMGGKEWTSK
jgi:hypothetical protein